MIPWRRDECKCMYENTGPLRKSEEKVGFPQAYIASHPSNASRPVHIHSKGSTRSTHAVASTIARPAEEPPRGLPGTLEPQTRILPSDWSLDLGR